MKEEIKKLYGGAGRGYGGGGRICPDRDTEKMRVQTMTLMGYS